MATPAYKPDNDFPVPGEYGDVPPAIPGMPAITFPLPGSEDQILSALSGDSLTNVIMAGFIGDNGFVNPLNRGRFCACRDEQNKVEGVALIGHTILFEAFSDRTIETFAALARRQSSPHLLMGERKAVERFGSYYFAEHESPRLVCPILWLEQRQPFAKSGELSELRSATREDLELVVQAQAAMAVEISGVDPLKQDPAGFCERYLRRIEQKRVWVLIENGRLIFKADVIAQTPQISYIEGVYVTAEQRGKGVGSRCVRELGRILLDHSKAIYLFVENKNTRTKAFYLNLGFTVAGQYDLVYF
jgi:ribosomal protein S18 acetylase RimI-like enzyme